MIRDDHQVLGSDIEADEGFDFRGMDHRRREQNAGDSGIDHDRGFGQGGDGDATSPRGNLHSPDSRRFVGLGVRPQADIVFAGEGGHGLDVALEDVEVDHQRRCQKGAPRVRLSDQRCIRSQVRHVKLLLAAKIQGAVYPKLPPILALTNFRPKHPPSPNWGRKTVPPKGVHFFRRIVN